MVMLQKGVPEPYIS